MGKKAKGSRKGKKAWRANINTDDIDDYFVKATKEANTGGSLAAAPNEALYYVDKSTEIPVKKKIEKHREKVLYIESLLQQNPFVQPIPSSTLKKSKKQKKKPLPKVKPLTQESPKDERESEMEDLNIWDKEVADETIMKEKKRPAASHIPAVEVEPPGCSFNPPFEAHQDSLAQAVAIEMQKSYKKELEPQPIPLIVAGEELDEEEKYFLDADNEDDEDDGINENENDTEMVQRKKAKRVTRVVLNRRARRMERMKSEEEDKKMKKLSKEIDSLPDIMKEIDREDAEKHKRHVRRVVAKQERLKTCPPRLGKHKYEPAPVQVLLSEEISGSLRKLKGCCTLTKDRYKSLEKRGIIVPRAR